jgi:hypothetical protein
MQDTKTEIRNHEGCYLYYDSKFHEFIRSGKVVNRSFETRHKEHRKSAELIGAGDRRSKFYNSYPTKGSAHGSNLTNQRRGYFDNLRLYCGLGFNRLTPGHRELFAKEAGVLSWDEKTLRRLENAKVGGDTHITKKQLHMVGYLFELCYDLAIPPENNVSESPGFEALGFFNTG